MKAIKNCRACGSEWLVEFLDLGKQYLSDFREDDSKPPKYPLVAVFCEDCKLVQLKHTTPQAEMYHDNYGFKSGINEAIKADLDDNVVHAFQYVNDPERWLDIGCNDGSLLSFIPEDIHKVGVEPVSFLAQEAQEHAHMIFNDYFAGDTARILGFWPPLNFDVVTTISCFYDMPDPSQFVQDVARTLDSHGVWIIQQNYLLTTMQLNAVDNFCHEHLEYYTLLSLENLLNRFGLEVNEVQTSTINGGSIRTIVSHKGTFDIDDSVQKQRDIEEEWFLSNIQPYKDFAEGVDKELNKLRMLVATMKAEGKTIGILAASTRGATIWQTAGIDNTLVDFAVERNPAKVGKMFSAIGVPIISELEAHKLLPDAMIIGPWFFASNIIDREAGYLEAGGSLIVPLPSVEIIYGST
jgi:NDP-4-keto-2,6-dideoxyhexose 3-C-methyltransferase